jgi:hypothetical protein
VNFGSLPFLFLHKPDLEQIKFGYTGQNRLRKEADFKPYKKPPAHAGGTDIPLKQLNLLRTPRD